MAGQVTRFDRDWARALEGQILDGRYRIEECIGAGGMGAVYRAEQLTLQMPVAIKVLKPEHASSDVYVRRFLREARAASRIRHSNVVRIIDFGQTDEGRVFFVMEHLQGEDLAKVVRRDGPMPWWRAREILVQIVRGLKAAHDVGVIHRDVKPANVFLVDTPDDEPDDVKVLDFGVAKIEDPESSLAEGLTGSDQVMGTAMYMAPEQAMGTPADARSDAYSVGAVAYQILTGRAPFRGATALEVLMKRVREPPPSVRDTVPNISPVVDMLVRRAMAREPAARFQSMRELEAAILSIPAEVTGSDGTDPSGLLLTPPTDTMEPFDRLVARPGSGELAATDGGRRGLADAEASGLGDPGTSPTKTGTRRGSLDDDDDEHGPSPRVTQLYAQVPEAEVTPPIRDTGTQPWSTSNDAAPPRRRLWLPVVMVTGFLAVAGITAMWSMNRDEPTAAAARQPPDATPKQTDEPPPQGDDAATPVPPPDSSAEADGAAATEGATTGALDVAGGSTGEVPAADGEVEVEPDTPPPEPIAEANPSRRRKPPKPKTKASVLASLRSKIERTCQAPDGETLTIRFTVSQDGQPLMLTRRAGNAAPFACAQPLVKDTKFPEDAHGETIDLSVKW